MVENVFLKVSIAGLKPRFVGTVQIKTDKKKRIRGRISRLYSLFNKCRTNLEDDMKRMVTIFRDFSQSPQ